MTFKSLLSALHRAFISSRRLLTPSAAMGALILAVGVSTLRAADAGSVTGTVSNTATGNLLEGARIEIPQLGLSALTDNTGRFVLTTCRRARTRLWSPTSASIRSAAR